MSELTTKRYSTSFSLGISFLHKDLQKPIYSIYGFVRFADEIVDTFHGYDKEKLLADFKVQTYEAIAAGISLNPILNSFQWVVNKYNIPMELIDTFLDSMEMDLQKQTYDQGKYETYILGSAEVVGLMCLKVFVEGDQQSYDELKPYAMKLGAAFQKTSCATSKQITKNSDALIFQVSIFLNSIVPSKKKLKQTSHSIFRKATKVFYCCPARRALASTWPINITLSCSTKSSKHLQKTYSMSAFAFLITAKCASFSLRMSDTI